MKTSQIELNISKMNVSDEMKALYIANLNHNIHEIINCNSYFRTRTRFLILKALKNDKVPIFIYTADESSIPKQHSVEYLREKSKHKEVIIEEEEEEEDDECNFNNDFCYGHD